jgi:glutamine amidotransferase
VLVGVVDYTVGNVGSVLNALRRAGAEPRVVRRPEEAEGVDALVLPGVGTYAAAYEMVHLFKSLVVEKPTLAICLGFSRVAPRGAAGGSAYLVDSWRGYGRGRFLI